MLGAKRKEIEITAKIGESVRIAHLSSESRTVLWLSQGLFLDVEDTALLIQGVASRAGFLSLKVYVNEVLRYPVMGAWAAIQEQGVSIKVAPVLAKNITETFECDTYEMGKIMARREQMSRKSPMQL